MSDTSIEWCDRVWNPVTGCTKIAPGCANCYAEANAKRFWKDRRFTDVQCHPDRLEQPLHWRKPARIFVNSMSDLFHEDVPYEFIKKVMDVIEDRPCKKHDFIVLTKRAARMNEFMWWLYARRGESPPICNLTVGISVSTQADADENIPLLLQAPAAFRCVSVEPMLEAMNLEVAPCRACNHPGPVIRWPCPQCRGRRFEWPDWVIVGGESGPNARPCNIEWIRSIRDQCQTAGVPLFIKQLGAKPFHGHGGNIWLQPKHPKGGDMSEWPEDLRVRQWPKVREP